MSDDSRPTIGPGDRASRADAERAEEFARAAADKQPGMLREFVEFLVHNKKWWLAPIILALLIFGLLIILAGTGAAPFIYTLF